MKRAINKNKVYDNVMMVDMSGNFLSFLDTKRANWYVKKGIGDFVQLNGKNTLKLKFEPAGRRQNNVNMNQRENLCVVCGTKLDLTRHHIIPSCFRTHMKFKEYCSHDILPICRKCHDIYEEVATKVKKELIEKYVPNFWGHDRDEVVRDLSKAKRCWSLINKDGENIPYNRFSMAVDFVYNFEIKYNKSSSFAYIYQLI